MRKFIKIISFLTLAACHGQQSTPGGVDVSAFVPKNGPQVMDSLGYQNKIGFPTLGAKFDLAGGCYGGVNAAGTEQDWEADNTCVEAQRVDVTLADGSVTNYGLVEFDPGNGSGGYYRGNLWNAAMEGCGPEITTPNCWYNLEDFERNELIVCEVDDKGDLVCAMEFYSTWDGIFIH